MLLYRSGSRLNESLELRVKVVGFGYKQTIVKDSQGEKDRIKMLLQRIIEPLKKHLCSVKEIHEEDLKNKYGNVYLPYDIEKISKCKI